MGFGVALISAGTGTEFLPSRLDKYRTLAFSSNIGIWMPGVVTALVGAVENAGEESCVSGDTREGVLSEVAEVRDMQDTDPLPLPL